jgi:hypothetical protein
MKAFPNLISELLLLPYIYIYIYFKSLPLLCDSLVQRQIDTIKCVYFVEVLLDLLLLS